MGLQKRLAYFLLIIPSFILPVSAEVIETFVCQSCSESQARDLATTKFDQPSCQFGDLYSRGQSNLNLRGQINLL